MAGRSRNSSSRADVGRAIYRRRADGVGGEEALWTGSQHTHVDAVTSDGKSLIVSVASAASTQFDLMRLAIDGSDRTLQPLIQTPFSESGASLSPDGRAMAYVSTESGRREVYVRAFPSLENKTQVSTAGGAEPVWARRGGELYFVSPKFVMAVPVQTGSTIAVGTVRSLFEYRYYTKGAGRTTYDVARDGRFLMVKEQPQAGAQAGSEPFQVVLNWFEELNAMLK